MRTRVSLFAAAVLVVAPLVIQQTFAQSVIKPVWRPVFSSSVSSSPKPVKPVCGNKVCEAEEAGFIVCTNVICAESAPSCSPSSCRTQLSSCPADCSAPKSSSSSSLKPKSSSSSSVVFDNFYCKKLCTWTQQCPTVCMPKSSSSSSKSSAGPICGNYRCEVGEADQIYPGGCGPGAPPECLGPPAQFKPGSCPNDCSTQKSSSSSSVAIGPKCGNGICEGNELQQSYGCDPVPGYPNICDKQVHTFCPQDCLQVEG